MQRWVELMGRHVGQSTVVLSTTFFASFRQHIVAIDEYAYANIGFRGDPDLALPKGARWDAMGKKFLTMFFNFSKVYTMFLYFDFFPRLN